MISFLPKNRASNEYAPGPSTNTQPDVKAEMPSGNHGCDPVRPLENAIPSRGDPGIQYESPLLMLPGQLLFNAYFNNSCVGLVSVIVVQG